MRPSGGSLTSEAPPYPKPSSPAVSAVMRANTKTGNRQEVRLRSELHRRGLRFRKNSPIRGEGWFVRPDIVFPRLKIAVFLDGCFWHACPDHGTTPRVNQRYWLPKLERNVARDSLNNLRLREAGWHVVRIWEHVPIAEAADVVEREVRLRRNARSSQPLCAARI
jgi:DNA mismatch endonuclease, patch repair protein